MFKLWILAEVRASEIEFLRKSDIARERAGIPIDHIRHLTRRRVEDVVFKYSDQVSIVEIRADLITIEHKSAKRNIVFVTIDRAIYFGQLEPSLLEDRVRDPDADPAPERMYRIRVTRKSRLVCFEGSVVEDRDRIKICSARVCFETHGELRAPRMWGHRG